MSGSPDNNKEEARAAEDVAVAVPAVAEKREAGKEDATMKEEAENKEASDVKTSPEAKKTSDSTGAATEKKEISGEKPANGPAAAAFTKNPVKAGAKRKAEETGENSTDKAAKAATSKPKAKAKPKAKKPKTAAPADPTLEHKRKISRLSSQRLRQREKHRFENLQNKQSELTETNTAIKQDNELIRNQIEQVKQIVKLKLELAVNPNAAAATAARAASETLAKAAATLAGSPTIPKATTTPAQAQGQAAQAQSAQAHAHGITAPGGSGMIPPSVLLALAQVKAQSPHAQGEQPAAAANAGADPPALHASSLPNTASLLGVQHKTMIAQNLIRRSQSAGLNPHQAALLAAAGGKDTAASAAAGIAAAMPNGDPVNDFLAQILKSRAAPPPQPAPPANNDVNGQLVQLLQARSQQHQQAAAAMEQLRAVLVMQGSPPPAAPSMAFPSVAQTPSSLYQTLLAGRTPAAPAAPAADPSNIQDLLRLVQRQQQQQQNTMTRRQQQP